MPDAQATAVLQDQLWVKIPPAFKWLVPRSCQPDAAVAKIGVDSIVLLLPFHAMY